MSMTREKAIEILESGSWSGYDDEEITEAVQMGADALKEQRPHGKWIPCSERLPDMNKKVLCACIANIYEVLELRAVGWFYDNAHIYMKGFVLAWMPLPEPYKKEGDKK